KQPWTKRTDNKIICFESLMHRWRLMHSAGYRFKIVNGKCKWITTAIPTGHIKRMRAVMQAIKHSSLFRPDQEIAFLIKAWQILRWTHVSFTLWPMLQQLP